MKILTIIVPTYNMERLLQKDLGSLVLKTEDLRRKLDVIVVIDGATDRSSQIAHSFADKWPETFRVIDKENGNYGSCINAALPLVQGKYVRIMDADDAYYTDALPEYLSVLEAQDADLILSPYDRVDEDWRVLKHEPLSTTARGGGAEDNTLIFSEIADGNSIYMMHNVAYRSALFRRIDYRQTEGISYTDMEWVFLPMKEVRTAYCFDRPIYRYLVERAGQTTDARIRCKHLDQEVQVLCKMLDIIRTVPVDNPSRRYMEKVIDYRVWTIYGMGLAKGSTLDLDAFDKMLYGHPDVYRRADNFTLDVGVLGLKFHYVRAWRKARSRRRMYLHPLYLLFVLMCHIRS